MARFSTPCSTSASASSSSSAIDRVEVEDKKIGGGWTAETVIHAVLDSGVSSALAALADVDECTLALIFCVSLVGHPGLSWARLESSWALPGVSWTFLGSWWYNTGE